ncbi:MAG: hypothetical protein JNG86_06890, partial [Verrucomicrobiaceae bacterium]|nr:hypothetical protein [Verrucomicrobiaceae bacterium]
AIFDQLGAEYPVEVARGARMGTRCEMALHLDTNRMLAAVQTLGKPYPWNGRALVLRVNAYLRAKHRDLQPAIDEMNLFLAQGGKIGGEIVPFTATVKEKPATATSQPMVLGVKP